MKRLVFPFFNAVIVAVLFGLLGYYLFNILGLMAAGAAFGFALGLAVEFGLKALGSKVYRWRLLFVILEIPAVVFLVGPYAYVYSSSRPIQSEICCLTPADFGAAYENVRIPVADGETLAGWYLPPTGKGGVTILVLHGSSSNRTGGFWHIEQLSRAGYGILAYDQRALGESTGKMLTNGWLDARDLPFLLDYLAAQPGVDPDRMGAVGLSLGAHILVNAAPGEPRLAALWLDGLGANAVKDFPEAQDVGEQFATYINGLLLNAMEVVIDYPPPMAVKDALPLLGDRPVVLVAAPLDDFEFRANQGFTPYLGEGAQQWFPPGTWHVGGPALFPDEYAARMVEFFDEAFEQ